MCDCQHIWSVSEITEKIKDALMGDADLRGFYVRGEITRVTESRGRQSRQNQNQTQNKIHLYFDIKERDVPLPCVIFDSARRRLDFQPQVGDKVVCGGYIDVYEPQGRYQMICTTMEEDGEGEAAAALERLKVRLLEEGLFSRKRPLPPFPKKIAVITSPTGAVIHDVIETTKMRYPITEICLIPATVQGESAVPTLIAGLRSAQTTGADVIIIGRGGGSKEDLNCFNDEALAREIYASGIPVISAVGHETDTTIADLAADARASTPTQAAEIAVPDIGELLGEIEHCRSVAGMTMNRALADAQRRIELLEKEIKLSSPRGRIAQWENEVQRVREALSNSIYRRIAYASNELQRVEQSVSDLNPMRVLQRGYSLTKCGGRVVSSVDDAAVGDMIEVKLSDGALTAEVKEIKK